MHHHHHHLLLLLSLFRSYHPDISPSGIRGTCTQGVREEICAGTPDVLIELFRGVFLFLQSNFWKTILNQAVTASFHNLSNK
jgi:hypothetical protein